MPRYGVKPPKSEIDKLVCAYGLKLGSASDGAEFKVQQRMHDRFMKVYVAMSTRYPDVDMSSATFWENLKSRAIQWWKSRPFRGTAVDW